MPKLILLTGFPFSGKTTFAKNANNIDYISIGQISRVNNINYPSNNQILKWVIKKINECKSNVLIIDNPFKYLHQLDMLNYYNKFDIITIWFSKSNFEHKIRFGRSDDKTLITKIRDFEIIQENIKKKLQNLYYHVDNNRTMEYINNFIYDDM